MNKMLISIHKNISGIIVSAVDTKPVDYKGKKCSSENEDSAVQCCLVLKALWGRI
jgi:hypothetical protein